MNPNGIVAVVAFLGTVAALPAHGGQFRGPPPKPVAPPGPLPTPGGGLAPARGVPAPPTVPATGPTTGGGIGVPDPLSWQTWWEFNKEPFLLRSAAVGAGPVTGSDDYYLGQRRGEPSVDVLAISDTDRSERIVPALARLMEQEDNRDVQSACLVALGRIGRDGPGVDLRSLLASRITRNDQEVRETAVLSLGISGKREAVDALLALVRDDSAGRTLSERAAVADRTRAFAAYGLGLLGRRSGDAAVAQRALEGLLPLLQATAGSGRGTDRDLAVAVVNGLGVLRRDPSRSADKRLAWQAVDELLEWFVADLGAGDEALQAHAPVAIARLLGRGNSPLHQRCKEQFVAELTGRKRRGPPILQSSAIALGMLVEPEGGEADAEAVKALRETVDRGRDLGSRWFSAIALGRIGGAENRSWLVQAYQKGSKAQERPWLALAVGLCAARQARAGAPDATLAGLLLDDLRAASNDDLRQALAVAVGLVGHDLATPGLLQLLREHEGDQVTAGYLCIGLGLLGDPAAAPQLASVLERSERRPFLLQQCAIALGCLGDKDAATRLAAMMKRSTSTAVLAALASAIGRIGDRRAIDSLIELTADKELTKLGRAFVAAALGWIGDVERLPWSAPFSVDANYATRIETLTNGTTGVLDIL
jgi:HEAT repeat protein